MTVVRIPPTLRSEVGGERQVEARATTVREVLDDLVERHPALGHQIFSDGEIATFVNVYLGGEDVRTLDGLDTAVARRRDRDPASRDGRRSSTPPRSLPVVSSLLDLVGQHAARRAAEASRRSRREDLRQARGPEPDRIDQGSRREVDDRGGRGVGRARRPGGTCSSRPPATPGISLAMIATLKGYPLTCVMPENATDERKRLLRLYGAEIVLSPGAEGSNGAVRLALEMAERDPKYFMPFQYANPANPRAHYEGTGRRDRRGARPCRRARRRARHRRHADGRGRAAARDVPRHRRRGRRAAPGRPGDGPPLPRRRLRAADPRRHEARPQDARLERGVGARGARAPRARGHLRRRLVRRGDPRRAQDRRGDGRGRRSWRSSPTPAGSTSPRTSGRRPRRDLEKSMERTIWW